MKKLFVVAFLMLGIIAYAQQDVTVTLMTGARPPDINWAADVVDAYEAMNPHTIDGVEYNVSVEVLAGPESATDRLGLYLQFFEAQSGEVDILQIDVIWPGDLAEHLVDLYQYDGYREAAAGHFPAIVENNTVDGALVGMPWFTDAGLLYYRTDLVEEYGFDGAPGTWAELEAMARTIQEGERSGGNPDFWGYVWQGNAYEGLTCDALEWVASFGGGQIIEPNGVISINNEAAIGALETAASWIGDISPTGVTGFQEEEARNLWQAGNSAFMRNWPYAYSLGQADDSPIAGNIGITVLPSATEGGTGAATLGGWQLAVTKYSSNPAVAADFALFLNNEENQLSHALELSLLPTIEAIYEHPDLLASNISWFADLLPVFRSAVARPSTVTAPQYGETSRLFFSAVHDVLTGSEDAETAMALLELDLQELHPDLELGQP